MRARAALALMSMALLGSCEPIPLYYLIAERVIGGTILYVDASAPADGDGNSWATAYRYLQDALMRANFLFDRTGWAPIIHVAEGVYYPDQRDTSPYVSEPLYDYFEIVSHVKLYGGFPSGGGTRDPAAHVTVLSGDIDRNDTINGDGVTENPADIVGTNAEHVLVCSYGGYYFVYDIGPDTVIDGFTITGGGSECAMLLSAWTCSPTLSNLVFQGNLGGGLSAMDYISECNPRLERVLFRRNSGGMTFTVDWGTSNPILIDVSFIENSTDGSGGGIRLDAAGGTISATLINTRFEGNSASDKGGAVYSSCNDYGTCSITFINALFVGNMAVNGGAIYNLGDITSKASLDLSLVNSSFSQNRASGYGGSVYSYYCSAHLDNCILWNDSAAGGGNEIYNNSASAVFTACDVMGSGGSGAWNSSLGTNGGGNIDQDPLFMINPNPGDGNWRTLGDNIYGNLVLLGGSPAANAGQSGLLPADDHDLDGDGNTSERIPFDLARNSREVGAIVDMGAFESQ